MKFRKHLFLMHLFLALCTVSWGQEDINVSEFDTHARQNKVIIENQKEIIKNLEETVSELKSQNKSLTENLNLLSNILITYINYLQNLEAQNKYLGKTLETMNEIQDRTSKELRNLRIEVTKLRDSVKSLSEKVAPQRNESR